MNDCRHCGAELGIGRYCTNCGAPVPAPDQAPGGTRGRPEGDTAERPAVSARTRPPKHPTAAPPPTAPPPTALQPAPPPPPAPPPYAGRFPLYADEAGPGRRVVPQRRATRRRRPVGWLLLAAGIVLVAVVGGILLFTGGEDEPDVAGTSGASQSSDDAGPGEEKPSRSTDPDDLAPHTSVEGPERMPPGRDLHGNPVRYPARNMLDDDPETAYRMPGDASGATLTFTLPQATTIDEVGLVNGYAKMDTRGGSTVDWYPRNRRILEVEWVFDDGTTLAQELDDDPDLQTIAVDDVQTTTIQLRIIEVSRPGPQGRNSTAVSDILIHGS
jgi:hypothetical protein